jgi:hypothetical protein
MATKKTTKAAPKKSPKKLRRVVRGSDAYERRRRAMDWMEIAMACSTMGATKAIQTADLITAAADERFGDPPKT